MNLKKATSLLLTKRINIKGCGSLLFFIIPALILLFILLLLFIPLKLVALYDKNNLSLCFMIGFLKFKLPFKKRAVKEEAKNKKSKKVDIDFWSLLQAFYDTSYTIKKTIRIRKLHIEATYGNEDPAFTGMMVGIAYAEIYKFLGVISCVFELEPPLINITSDFSGENVFTLSFEGIICTRLAHIVFTALKYYKNYKSHKKGKD